MSLSRDTDFIITSVQSIRRDTIEPGKKYVQQPPRDWNTIDFIISGQGLFNVRDENLLHQKGDMIFFRSEILNETLCLGDQPLEYIYINFHTLDDRALEALQIPYVTTLRHPGQYRQMFETLLRLWERKTPGYLPQCRAGLYEAINLLLTELPGSQALQLRQQRLLPAVDYISAHYADPALSVSSLAALCGMSVRTFCRLFTSFYGSPPTDFILQTRINNAIELLRNSNNSVSQAAEQVGYANVYSFSRSFKKVTGVSPTQYQDRPDVKGRP